MSRSLRISTIGRKQIMALTGLYLCLFLAIHLAGNLQLLLPEAEARSRFNAYSQLLSGNLLIKLAGWITYASILCHALIALRLNRVNAHARGETRYAVEEASETSGWSSRHMGWLGALLLLFLVVHMRTFWYEYHWGPIGLDPAGRKDLYAVVVVAFSRPWYVAAYGLCMLGLGLHLAHGLPSAFRTLGLYPTRYFALARVAGLAFAVATSAGFALLPIVVYVRQLR